MKKAFFSVISIVGILVLLVIQAQATLIEVDWGAQEGAILRDTGTGLEWLDVSQSVGLSILDVTGQMGTGQKFEGFRYAEESEVRSLFISAGITEIDTGLHSENVSGVEELLSKWDAELNAAERYGHMLINTSYEYWGTVRHRASYLDIDGIGAEAEAMAEVISRGGGFSTTFSAYDYGSALVRPIPDAGTPALLMGAGVIAIAASRRKRRK